MEPPKPAGSGGFEPPERAWVLFVRAMRLRCPVCGVGPVFRGWLRMIKRCDHCGLWFEREPGYFLGSIYFNYGLTVLIVTIIYLVPMFWLGRPVQWLIVPLVLFCLVFPLYFFRYSRCLFLSFDHYFSRLDPEYRPPFEKP
jgi:uncharacterized protein (DUF983 family)